MRVTPISVKRTYQLNIDGIPAKQIDILDDPDLIALLPEQIPMIKPKLMVKTGDRVKIGTVLFYDKLFDSLKFVSPAGGMIKDVVYGPRRVIRQIVIERDSEEKRESFPECHQGDLAGIDRQALIDLLLKSGIWPFIRALPLRNIARPEAKPYAILVSLDAKEPFCADPDVYLDGHYEDFRLGIAILKKLSDYIIVHCDQNRNLKDKAIDDMVTHRVTGGYPAHDSGVVLFHVKKEVAHNHCWFVGGQDVIAIGSFFRKEQYPIERVISVGGSEARQQKYFKTRMGVPVSHLFKDQNISAKTRVVIGGILTGFESDSNGFVGFYETAVNLLPKGEEKEAFGFIRPGFAKPSYSKTFLSVFNREPMKMNCNMHGSQRACINCGTCARVCPVNILPQYMYKAIYAELIEETLAHGLLDCVECGLCSYVCPSKIELTDTFKTSRLSYFKEQL